MYFIINSNELYSINRLYASTGKNNKLTINLAVLLIYSSFLDESKYRICFASRAGRVCGLMASIGLLYCISFHDFIGMMP